MAARQLSDGNDAGTILGTSASDLVGFYGVTPCDQPASTAQSAVLTTALTTITDIVTTASLTGAFNSVVSRLSAVITLVNALQTDLVQTGIIKGSA